MKLPARYSELEPAERRAVRETYIRKQGGACYWCFGDLDLSPPSEITDHEIDWDMFPPNFLRYPVHLQHDHGTDMTEGAVHAYCNAVMWQYHGR